MSSSLGGDLIFGFGGPIFGWSGLVNLALNMGPFAPWKQDETLANFLIENLREIWCAGIPFEGAYFL